MTKLSARPSDEQCHEGNRKCLRQDREVRAAQPLTENERPQQPRDEVGQLPRACFIEFEIPAHAVTSSSSRGKRGDHRAANMTESADDHDEEKPSPLGWWRLKLGTHGFGWFAA
jgi:hypothetical protein